VGDKPVEVAGNLALQGPISGRALANLEAVSPAPPACRAGADVTLFHSSAKCFVLPTPSRRSTLKIPARGIPQNSHHPDWIGYVLLATTATRKCAAA
jgi:hypothetical protein